MAGNEIFWIPIGAIHIIFTFFCVVSYQTVSTHKHWWMNILLLIPFVNVILVILSLDIVAGVYSKHVTRLEGTTGEYARKVILLEGANREHIRAYADLERRKFRKVRLGDTFMCPDTDDWIDGYRGKKHTIIEIKEDLNEKYPVITKSKEGKRYKNSWDSLRKMIFLSDEPVKPFEFLCEKE